MGCFKDGLQHGYGREHYIHSGEIHFGEWETGKPVGKKYTCVMKHNHAQETNDDILNHVHISPETSKQHRHSIYIV